MLDVMNKISDLGGWSDQQLHDRTRLIVLLARYFASCEGDARFHKSLSQHRARGPDSRHVHETQESLSSVSSPRLLTVPNEPDQPPDHPKEPTSTTSSEPQHRARRTLIKTEGNNAFHLTHTAAKSITTRCAVALEIGNQSAAVCNIKRQRKK